MPIKSNQPRGALPFWTAPKKQPHPLQIKNRVWAAKQSRGAFQQPLPTAKHTPLPKSKQNTPSIKKTKEFDKTIEI